MKCNICGSEMKLLPGNFCCDSTGVTLQIYVCKCGLISKEVQPNDYFDKAYIGELNNPYYNDNEAIIRRNKQRVNYVRRFVGTWRKAKFLLDYGAGLGHFVYWAHRYFYCIGVEKSLAAIDNSVFYLHKNVPTLVNYDVITLWDVIEHLERPKETIRELVGYLNDGGYVFVETANADFWDKKSHWPYLNIDHNFYFSQDVIVRLMGSEGLKFVGIINTRKYLRYLFPIVKKSNKVLTIYVFKK